MPDWYNLKYQTLTICRDEKAIVSSCMHAGGYSAHVQEEGAGAAVAVLPEALPPAAGVPLSSKSTLWLLLFLENMCGSAQTGAPLAEISFLLLAVWLSAASSSKHDIYRQL